MRLASSFVCPLIRAPSGGLIRFFEAVLFPFWRSIACTLVSLCALVASMTSTWASDGLVLEAVRTTSPPAMSDRPSLDASDAARFGAPLPDGEVASSPRGDIRQAWLSEPTGRYGHGVLGDRIEAGAVTVRLDDGSLASFVLPQGSVFEDLTPRLGDLDGDGRIEIVLVRAYLRKGAALAVLGMRGGQVTLLAQTKAIGMANRWLNPSILADLDGSGRLTIGLVRTPHIGGQLQLWQYRDAGLDLVAWADGFSNHSIGSRALGLSAIVRKGNKARILMPDANQSHLVLLDPSDLDELASIPLPARPAGDFVVETSAQGAQRVLLPLSDGQVYALSDPQGHLFD